MASANVLFDLTPLLCAAGMALAFESGGDGQSSRKILSPKPLWIEMQVNKQRIARGSCGIRVKREEVRMRVTRICATRTQLNS